MTTTTTRLRVRIVTQADGKAHILNADTYQRLATEDSAEEAEIKAIEQGWHVVNPRPLGWAI